MATATLTLARAGYWDNGTWNNRSGAWLSSRLDGYAGFTGLDAIPAAFITNVQLTIPAVGSATATLYVVDGPAADPPPNNGVTSMPKVAGSVALNLASPTNVDITAMVVAARQSGTWGPTSVLGLIFDRTGGLSNDVIPTVTVTYVTTQYLSPVPVTAGAEVDTVGSVDRAVNPVMVDATAQVPVPELIAPRAVYVNPVDASAVVNVPAAFTGTGDAPDLNAVGPITATAEVLVPTLTRTLPPEPPPIPWERLIEDPLFHEALAARRPVTSSRAEIISPDGAVIARLGGTDRTHRGALSGTVTCRGNASIRWECDLVLDNPELMPTNSTDLLHPASMNRLRIWWGIRLPDDTWGWIPVGTYHPDLTPTSDQGGVPSVTIRGSSSVAVIKEATWDVALDLSDLTISQAIVQILTNRAPWVTISVTPTDQKVPSTYEPGSPGSDPWVDVEKLAYAAGMVAYEDRMGVIKVEPRPELGPPRADFTEGPASALREITNVETDMQWAVNKITVVSASPDVEPPATGVAVDDDPTSPAGRMFLAGRLYHRRVENAIITTDQAAETMARNLLADRGVIVRVSANVRPHPHLDPGDTITIGRGQVGVAGDHLVESWVLGLTPGDAQAIDATSKKERIR